MMDCVKIVTSNLVTIINLKIINVFDVNRKVVIHTQKQLVNVQHAKINISLSTLNASNAKILIAINVNQVSLCAKPANHTMD